MKFGLYESIINKSLAEMFNEDIQVQKEKLDEGKLPRNLSKYFASIMENGLKTLKQQNASAKEQIEFCNYLIEKVSEKTNDDESYFEKQKLLTSGEMLLSLVDNKNSATSIKTIYPKRTKYSIAEPFIFTGANTDAQFLNELKNEIESCEEIDFIVSFIKWSGVVRILDDLKSFTDNGGKLRVITTTYTGATDPKAIEALVDLKNTEIKVSYDSKNTRLHAKSYIFKRKTGFSTAYVGSSNISNAALTSGTEWNVKVTEKEMNDVYAKICGTFETYWQSENFENYTVEQKFKLREKISQEKNPRKNESEVLYNFDIYPYPYQQRVLDNLKAEREIRNNYKNLVVAATGTGKTVMSAFDFKDFVKKSNKKVRLLFVAHREEILKQSISCFRAVLKDHNFGDIMVGGSVADSFDNLFISIQTFNSKKLHEKIEKDFYDYIIIDEFHHAAAESYQVLLNHFTPKILLGLTATPERMDGKDILKYFNNRISSEIRLPEAINRNLLVPFSYFGVSDNIDLSDLKWVRGGYDKNQLSNVLTGNDIRTSLILSSLDKYLNDIDSVKGIGFCVSKEHAEYMSNSFNKAGISSIYLTSDSKSEVRDTAKQKLVSGEVKFIFVVDLYNEGVDIPEINTVLFLRPTESLTVFLQQLGRGLRTCKDKDSLTVLDYVGQANRNYKYSEKYTAILSSNAGELSNEIKYGFPNLPKGCYVQLEKKAQVPLYIGGHFFILWVYYVWRLTN